MVNICVVHVSWGVPLIHVSGAYPCGVQLWTHCTALGLSMPHLALTQIEALEKVQAAQKAAPAPAPSIATRELDSIRRWSQNLDLNLSDNCLTVLTKYIGNEDSFVVSTLP